MNKQDLNYHFFIIIPPGLEDIALLELQEIAQHFKSFHILQKEKGGIEITGPLETCALINLKAKIPSRVLLRLDSFRCRDFPKLYQKIKKIKWGDWCYGPKIEGVQSSSKDSTLFDSRKIKKAAEDALTDYFKENPPKKKEISQANRKFEGPTLFLRFVDDLCTLSLDTSGERLGKRGLKEGTHISPLRENLASACLQFLFHKIENKNSLTLLDPMCGSGTFITEALPYLLKRDFSFEYLPLMAPIKKNSTKRLCFQQTPKIFPLKEVMAFDIDQKAIDSCQKNIKALGLNPELSPPLTILKKDFFSPNNTAHIPSILICNPPYGERLALNQNSKSYLQSFIDNALKNFAPHYMGLLFPQESWPHLSKKIKKLGQLDFNHGGIDVSFRVFNTQI